MVAASRIKPRPTPRTLRPTPHILPNSHLQPASPTQDRPLIPPFPPPNRNSMPRHLFMTILASPINPATSHLDRHNIQLRPPVHTPRLRINLHPAHPQPLPTMRVNHRHSIPTPVALRPFSYLCVAATSGGHVSRNFHPERSRRTCFFRRCHPERSRSQIPIPIGRDLFLPRCHPKPAEFWRCEGSVFAPLSSRTRRILAV
jgi:hypothetical protein